MRTIVQNLGSFMLLGLLGWVVYCKAKGIAVTINSGWAVDLLLFSAIGLLLAFARRDATAGGTWLINCALVSWIGGNGMYRLIVALIHYVIWRETPNGRVF
jgi:hypothetical protein